MRSGVDVPAVRPTVSSPSNHSSRNSDALATWYARQPRLIAISVSLRLLLLLSGLPTTTITLHSAARARHGLLSIFRRLSKTVLR